MRYILLVSFALVSLFTTHAIAKPKGLKIIEKTKFYRIKGKSAAEFAYSMSNNGPYSREHGKRAWATAARDLDYTLIHQKFKRSCRIKNARVRMKITYNMPKLNTARRVSKQQRKKWRKMYALLNKHERTHGLYYRQFAAKVHRALNRMPATRTCRGLERQAKRIVEKLSDKDRVRNDRFDRRDRRNYRRMERLYSGT